MFVFNTHIAGLSKFSTINYEGIVNFNNKKLVLKDGVLYEYGSGTETVSAEVEIGSIDLQKKCYTIDAVLYRSPISKVDMNVTSKEGVDVDYSFTENKEKINLAKGHKSRYFTINLTTTETIEIDELKLILEETVTIE